MFSVSTSLQQTLSCEKNFNPEAEFGADGDHKLPPGNINFPGGRQEGEEESRLHPLRLSRSLPVSISILFWVIT